MKKNYIIIGGVAAGASAAVRLRRLDETASITILDKGPFISYSNCSLPYRISEVVDSDDKLILSTPQEFKAKFNIDVRVLNEVVGIDEDDKQVVINDITTNQEYKMSYDKLIISTGSKAIKPNIPGLDTIVNFTLKNVPDATKLMNYINEENPSHITVVGGGFIGIEVAENLKKRGIDVTLIEGDEQLMKPLDEEIAMYPKQILEQNGVEVILNKQVAEFTNSSVILNDKSSNSTDAVVLAIGIRPETSFLNNTSIKLNKQGYILTDDNYQTSNCDIYAGGDAIVVRNSLTNALQPLALAGPANKQGRLIADHISGKQFKNKGYIGSSVIKIFDYTIANTGLNEKQLIESNIEYEAIYISTSDKVSLMPNANEIKMKLLFKKDDGLVLGAQGISKGNVDKRIDVIATAIKFGATVYDLLDLELAYAPHHGTGKDVVNKLGYIGSNLVDGLYKQVSFKQITSLVSKEIQLIDVRPTAMFEANHLEGASNIPFPTLRNNYSKIDKSKPVYIICNSGYTSYNSTLMLNQLGFNAINVAGGMTWLTNYNK